MLSLVIDIQSDVIEGTLIRFQPKGVAHVPEILYSTSVHVPRKLSATGEYMAKLMLRAIEDLALNVAKEMNSLSTGPIQSIHYILSSPWILSQSKMVEVKFEKDTAVTEAMVKQVIENSRQELIKTYEPDMVFIEQKVFDVELNGYSVANYLNKKARSLRISFAFTLSSETVVKKIKGAVAQHLRIKDGFFHSAILLQYLTSRAVVKESEEYIVLHIHGELTDVVVVKKGFSSYLASFPYGTTTLVRKISASLKNNTEATASMINMYMEKKLSDEEQAKLETVLFNIINGWRAEAKTTFAGIGEHVIMPRKIHLYSNTPFAPLFKKTLEEENFDVVIHDEPLREVHSFALKDVI
jgi:cell division ATPase FtsA